MGGLHIGFTHDLLIRSIELDRSLQGGTLWRWNVFTIPHRAGGINLTRLRGKRPLRHVCMRPFPLLTSQTTAQHASFKGKLPKVFR